MDTGCGKMPIFLLRNGLQVYGRHLVIGILLLAALSTAAEAQQPAKKPTAPDSATMAQSMAQLSGMFNQMGPMYENMMQAMIEGTLKAMERPETIDRLAAFTRHYYDALIKQGFTKDEALEIVAGVGIPALHPSK